ncbi:hypothetical protein Tsubulata_022606 [Turnera subulata]|uniref:KIB1-4 beta-propeller domain-containing protein n=1 Tax=Turnera subulata TaxID=218843 RepID=A0A9Q0FCW9_9ROSI|nr:hypothetical protein Tsubulata_022606 [Turnera subulata]
MRPGICCFEICDVVLHADAIYRGDGQVIPIARRVIIYSAQLIAKPILLIPSHPFGTGTDDYKESSNQERIYDIGTRKDQEYAIVNYKFSITGMYSKIQWKNMLGLQKVVLSSTPAAHDFVALAIYGGYDRLTFCKYGDDKWTSLQTPSIGFSDMIFYEGKFYVICHSHLVVCDPESLPNVVAHHVEAPEEQCHGIMWYLVGSLTYGLLTVSRK